MYKWTAFPFIRVALCLSTGIVGHSYFPGYWEALSPVWVAIGIICILCSAILVKWPVWKGASILLVITYLGGYLAMVADSSRSENHYAHHPYIDGFVGIITSDNTERDNHHRYEMAIKLLYEDGASIESQGKIYFYVSKDSSTKAPFQYGDVLAVNRSYFDVAPPKNPDEFNYKSYLEKQNIFAHAFVALEETKKIGFQPKSSLRQWAFSIRTGAKDQLERYIEDDRERSILTALLLGIKDYLDDDLQTAYASAGAMHVLAVSGLHVGIVFIMLSFLCKSWKDTKVGNIIFTIGSVLIIWLYALVTGFSPSVMRATTMFTVIIISSGLSRRANIYNSLGIAAIVLILFDPFMIYSVGFQLSFVAVLGIVILHPRLYHLIDFNTKVTDYIWSITCVSIAAQLATFPLSMLYFHQFPTYFLISNLVVIPAATVMLGAGIGMLLFGSIFDMLGQWIGFLLEKFVWIINEIITALQFLPKPIFDWLYFDALDTLLVYLILFFLVLTFIKYSYEFAVLTTIVTVLLFGWLYFKSYTQLDQKRITFYEIDDVTAIDLIAGNHAQLLLDNPEMGGKEVVSFQIDPSRLANGLPKSGETWADFRQSNLIKKDSTFDLLLWENIRIALIKDLSNHDISDTLVADYFYFNDPKSIVKVPLKSKAIILGTGFAYYDIRKAKELLSATNIPVHSLTQDGFWTLDLSTGY
ncbi:MAG: competence protein ComEC [Marinoscillum sp.]|jgi:competence protein ComEC